MTHICRNVRLLFPVDLYLMETMCAVSTSVSFGAGDKKTSTVIVVFTQSCLSCWKCPQVELLAVHKKKNSGSFLCLIRQSQDILHTHPSCPNIAYIHIFLHIHPNSFSLPFWLVLALFSPGSGHNCVIGSPQKVFFFFSSSAAGRFWQMTGHIDYKYSSRQKGEVD